MRPLSPLLLLLAAAGLAAVETGTTVADVRVSLGIAPMVDEIQGTAVAPASEAGKQLTERYEDSPGLAAALTSTYGRLAPVGPLIGIQLQSVTGTRDYSSLTYDGVHYTRANLEATAGDTMPGMSFSQSSIAANLGLGWALSPVFHLELIGIAGLAWTTMSAPANLGGPNLETQQGKGWGNVFGGRLGGYWTSQETGWQCGLEVEYTRFDSELTFSYLDTKHEVDAVNEGLGARFVVGHRF